MRKDKPSRTAYKVALVLVTLGIKPGMDSLLPPGIVSATKQLLLASGAAWPRTIRWAESKAAVSVYEAFDWMLPGQFEAFAHRKAFFESQVREAVGSGAGQVLVLGAGYDTLAWRLAPEFPQVSFFEIDHPATARLKAKGLSTMGHHDNLFLIAEDLGQHRFVDVLKNHASWRMKTQSVILAEGLLMYLFPEAVSSLFCQSAEMVNHGSRLVFSSLATGADGRPDAGRWTGLMLWLQKMIGESWHWSVRPEELGSFLKQNGWQYLTQFQLKSNIPGVEFYAVATK